MLRCSLQMLMFTIAPLPISITLFYRGYSSLGTATSEVCKGFVYGVLHLIRSAPIHISEIVVFFLFALLWMLGPQPFFCLL